MSLRMEDHELPIFIETIHFLLKDRRFAKIVGIRGRTRCTRLYSVEYVNGDHVVYRGAASRPRWIRHIFKNKAEWLIAQNRTRDIAVATAHSNALDKELSP